MRIARAVLFAALVLSPSFDTADAQAGPLAGYDDYIAKAMQDWKVPGMAIAIVRNDSVVFMKGYGTRTVGTRQPVDGHTVFAIGSVSKAFTATLIAMLVDEGKMSWDDPATKHLPEFELFDPYVTREITVRDMLAHRSGLSRGDLLWRATIFSSDEILRRVRFLKPSWSMRARYGYQNIMYLAAGQAASRAAGKSWDVLVRERIFTPLGMNETNASTRALATLSNVATPHQEIDDTLRVIPWLNIDAIAPAGSINSTVSDMTKWMRFQLAEGKAGGKSLVSASALGETRTPQVVIPLSPSQKQVNPFTHLGSYGMGWRIADYRGREINEHGGNIDGMSAYLSLVPEEKIGIVVLTNANTTILPTVAAHRALDALLGAPPRDWSAEYLKLRERSMLQQRETVNRRLAQRVANTKPSLPLHKYAGTYSDSMYGDVKAVVENGALRVTYGSRFDGTLEHWHFDTFRAGWNNRSFGWSFVTFALDADGKVKSIDVENMATFGRKPEAPDTTRRPTVSQPGS